MLLLITYLLIAFTYYNWAWYKDLDDFMESTRFQLGILFILVVFVDTILLWRLV